MVLEPIRGAPHPDFPVENPRAKPGQPSAAPVRDEHPAVRQKRRSKSLLAVSRGQTKEAQSFPSFCEIVAMVPPRTVPTNVKVTSDGRPAKAVNPARMTTKTPP